MFFKLFTLTLVVFVSLELTNGYSIIRGSDVANLTAFKGADIKQLKETYLDIFASPRSNSREKKHVRETVIKLFKEFGMETETQEFTASGSPGVNLIGIRPGKNRRAGKTDSIIVVASHYDTVSRAPGVDDNGSGSLEVVEIARLLHQANADLDHTVIFVCNDLEELGLLGSKAFVNEWLIPKELLNKDTQFLGAYVIDMDLIYDPKPGAQSLPGDIVKSCPEESARIKKDGNRGDFHATWMRTGVDDELMNQLTKEWKKTEGGKKFKLRPLSASNPLPSTFYRSDHASFWFPKVPGYTKPLRAMLVTDLGPFRGIMADCYHSPCDDKRHLTDDNLNFIKASIDSIAGVILNSPPAKMSHHELADMILPEYNPPANITEWY